MTALPRQQKATAFGPWMNASRQWTGDVAPLGREVGATGFARGAPQFHEREDFIHSMVNLGHSPKLITDAIFRNIKN